jgi:hypothetical protein
MEFEGVVVLTESGEKRWSWVDFVKELKEEAGRGNAQIHTTETVTSVFMGTMGVVFGGEREERFWSTMEQHGWHSGMHPRVVRRKRR